MLSLRNQKSGVMPRTAPKRRTPRVSTRAFIYSAVILAAATPELGHADWPQYDIYRVALVNNFSNEVFGVNSYNEVVGDTNFANPKSSLGLTGGANIASSGVLMPPGCDFLQFYGVNEGSMAVGRTSSGGWPQAVTYSPSGGLSFIFSPTTMLPGSEAYAINHGGTVIGSLFVIDPKTGQHRAMFRYDTVTHLVMAWPLTNAGGINDNGLIASTPLFQAPELDLISKTNAVSKYFPPASFGTVWPAGISTVGGVIVVGAANRILINASGSASTGFLFNQSNHTWYGMPDPTKKNYETDPLAVDYWGQKAVGYSLDAKGVGYATVWEDTGNHSTWAPTALHTVLGDPVDWQFNRAVAISPLGAIAGMGVYQGSPTAFIAVPKHLIGFDLDKLAIIGGLSMHGTLKLSTTNPYALSIDGLTSSTVVKVPSHMTLPAGNVPLSFPVDTQGVDKPTTVEIAVGLRGIRATMKITVNPAILLRMTVTPSHILSGRNGNAEILLNGSAGPSGSTIHLSCADPAVRVPATVKVAPGSSSVAFGVSVGAARGSHNSDIIATLGDGSVRTTITIG